MRLYPSVAHPGCYLIFARLKSHSVKKKKEDVPIYTYHPAIFNLNVAKKF